MKLVIAEKPSVAQSLARVIGATKRQDGYLEGGGYLVSWCVGHLVELSAPERYDERFAKWRLEDLPILPERWLYEVSQTTRKQYQILKSLMERPDVTSLVCATDAGREGELIFRLVYNQARCKGDKKTRHLIATDKGNALITVMPEQIQSPSMTAEWEQKLLGIERGEYEAADFMDGISGMIAGLVTTYEKAKGADALMSRNKVIGKWRANQATPSSQQNIFSRRP